MANKFAGGIKAGSTSVSIDILIRKKTDNTGLTGLVYNTSGNIASYHRQGAGRAAITLATQTVTGAYSSGGFVEIDATNMPGLYRLDIPDAALASGVEFVTISMVTTNGFTYFERIALETAGAAELSTQISALENVSVADILTTQMTEAYATDGQAPTLAQAMFMVMQGLLEFVITGTTVTTKKINKSTTAMTHTLDDATEPTSRTRST